MKSLIRQILDGLRRGGKNAFGIELRHGPGSVAAAISLSAAFSLLLFFTPGLLFEEGGERSAFRFRPALLFAGLLLACCALCFIKLRMPRGLQAFLGWVVLPVLPYLVFLSVEAINSTRYASFTARTKLANYLVYLMVFSLIFTVCRRVWITALAGGGIFLLFGIVNYFLLQFRGAPILPWDLQTVDTALMVAGGYTYRLTETIFFSLELFALTVLLCYRLCPAGKGRASRRTRLLQRGCALTVTAVLAFLIFPGNLLMKELGITVWAWNQKSSSRSSGVAAGFAANVQYLMVEKPAGYSPARMEELEQELLEMEPAEPLGEPGGQPTVIVVMNESLTDLTAVSGGELLPRPDNLPFLHSLEQSGKVLWGTAYAPVFGGNTCNSEYEFLTGNSTYFLPMGCKPYQQYVREPQPSLVRLMKDQGYKCVAIHPGQRAAWQRNSAYPYLGFDEFLDYASFDVKREFLHSLTTDRSCCDQIIYEYENRGSRPLFVFNVTIQNHGGYQDENVETTIRVQGHEGEWPQTEQYLSLTRESDRAFEELIGYFSGREDPVVILFFGDHWPNVEQGFFSCLFGKDELTEIEDVMRQYEVPFVLWANYPIETGEVEKISFNYLPGLLLRAAGLPETGYLRYLEKVRLSFPVITANGVITSEGDCYKTGEAVPDSEGLLNGYAVLQYNNIFGKGGKRESLFSLSRAEKGGEGP